MSLIMNGVDNPKNCLLCPCCVGEGTGMGRQHYCQAIDGEPYVSENHRPENCPIPKIPVPHGRLIDADRLIAVLKSAIPYEQRTSTVFCVIKNIENAPTVIEAEK